MCSVGARSWESCAIGIAGWAFHGLDLGRGTVSAAAHKGMKVACPISLTESEAEFVMEKFKAPPTVDAGQTQLTF